MTDTRTKMTYRRLIKFMESRIAEYEAEEKKYMELPPTWDNCEAASQAGTLSLQYHEILCDIEHTFKR